MDSSTQGLRGGIDGIERTVGNFRRYIVCVFTSEEVDTRWVGNAIITKDLQKLATHLKMPICRILVVDDNSDAYSKNPANAL